MDAQADSDEKFLGVAEAPHTTVVNATRHALTKFQEDETLEHDELLDLLDDEDFDFGTLREQRMEEVKANLLRSRQFQDGVHGHYSELTDEKEIIDISASEERCLVHFAHRDFRRCRIMDQHLEALAPRYVSTRMVKVLVENVPWLVDKLGVRVLPCVVCFVKGIAKHKLIGFEEFGNDDSFSTSLLEFRLDMTGVLEKQLERNVGRDQKDDHKDDDEYDFDM